MHGFNGFQKMVLFFLLTALFSCSKDSDEASRTDRTTKQLIAEQILIKTNAIRRANGLTDLTQNDEMDQLAVLHSENMITFNFFDHVDHENKSPSNRADDLNFAWSRIAENIGKVPWFQNVTSCGDTRSVEAISECVVEGWKNSPGHYANMIGDFEELGVGVAFTKDSIAYFTQVFRTP
jgi:uncharacterized protein YkwD